MIDWILLGFELSALYLVLTSDLKQEDQALAVKFLASCWIIVSIMHTIMEIGKL